jgi:hypothetical protein
MNIYDRRWLNALHWAQKIKASFDTEKYLLMYEGELYTSDKWKFEIDEEDKFIRLNSLDGSTRNMIYDYDLDWDHIGSSYTIEATNVMLSKYKLYRMEE